MQTTYLACKARARKIINERLKHFNTVYSFNFGQIRIKDLKTRWGSCSSDKNLNFNYKILFLPPELVDYIVVHELCHLAEMNHSWRFWQLVGHTIPDYKKRIVHIRRIEREIHMGTFEYQIDRTKTTS
jgi:predicted metal-dependent hydrolase